MRSRSKVPKASFGGGFVLLLALALPSHAAAQTCVQPPVDLVSWWPGDGNATDLQGNNDGTLENGAVFAAGMVGQAFAFDGIDDKVTVPSIATLEVQQFTVDAWVLAQNAGSANDQIGGIITTKDIGDTYTPPFTSWTLTGPGTTGRFHAFVGFTDGSHPQLSSTNTFAFNQFHLVAMTWDGSTLSLYVDGQLEGTLGLGAKTVSYSGEPLTMGEHNVSPAAHRAFGGVIDEVEIYSRALSAAEIGAIFAAGSAGKCKTGSVLGLVTADCPTAGTALIGVRVDAFEVGTGDLAGTGATNANGEYLIEDLAAGQYTITIVTPLGYMATPELPVTVSGGEAATANFSLHCVTVTANPRSIGFWKHQVGVATGGKGNAQIGAGTLCSYLDLIGAHFNSNAINQVIVYQPPASGTCGDKLQVAKALLNLAGGVAMVDRARQQLMALLLNVAAGYISQTHVISPDGATVSQAITYCDNIIDDPAGDYETAKTIADYINNGLGVPAGMIPLSTATIAYRRGMEALSFRVSTNAGSAARDFRFVTAARGPITLALYDVSGRLVSEIYRGDMDAGAHSVRWNGRMSSGEPTARGLYFARLQTPRESPTIKVLQLTRK